MFGHLDVISCAQTTNPSPNSTPQMSSDAVSFYTTKTRLWKSRSQIICFQVPQTAIQDRSFSCTVDEKFLQVLVPPRVLPGEKIGYLRVKPLAEGKSQIGINGAKLDVDIVSDPAYGSIAEFNPRIVSPSTGANVWGDFSVGVEQFTMGDPSQLPIPVVRLPSGKELTGKVVPDQNISQYGRWVFDLKTSDLAPGLNQLVAVQKNAAGKEIASNSIEVVAIAPDPASIQSGFCKDVICVDHPAKTPPQTPHVINDDKYGQGMMVNAQGSWWLPLSVEKTARYQMFVTACGRIGGDGLPSLSVAPDENGQAGTTVRLPTTEWRRVPIGYPLTLTPGEHILSVRMGNRFAQGSKDIREGYIQKFELARLDDAGVQVAVNHEVTDSTLPMTAPTMMMEAAAARSEAGDLSVVFDDNLDGQMVVGPVDFGAECWWPNRDHSPPPRVELYVNNKLVASQDSGQPHFTIDPSSLVVGSNRLQLRAVMPSGLSAKSAELGVEVPKDFPMPTGATPQIISPKISISYAPQEIGSGKTDAVVAQVMDQHAVTADLVIDGQPQHLDLKPEHGLGPLLLPLLTRDLKSGQHKLKVIAKDDAGNQAESAESSFTISAGGETALNRYERAVFLLNRFAFGPEPGEIAAILTMGEQKWLESRLAQGEMSPGEANMQEWLRAETVIRGNDASLVMPAIQYLLLDPNPVRARFLIWTENHFSTWMRKDGYKSKYQEHQHFLQLGPAPFFDLLFTSATSPAMLVYLDQRYSYANRLNENYAREIMELHTLGVKGGYTQTDVTTLANLLTGWTLTDEAQENGAAGGQPDLYFGYDPELNSGKELRILGLDFPAVDAAHRFDRVLMALEMLSAHPSCATFVSRKLCEHYVSDPAPPDLVQSLAQVYLETGGDMSAMLVAMSQHPSFWSSPAKVANPIDFSIRNSRLSHNHNPMTVYRLISTSGMGLFDRPTPDGYPEDDGYSVNTNAMLQRWRFSKGIQNDFLQSGVIPNSLKPADTAWTPDLTQRIIDLAAVRITGNTLSDASNEAVQQLLADAPASTESRLHILTTMICQSPENSLK